MISVRAPVGPTNVAVEKCCIGRGLAAIKCSGDVDKDFLLVALRFLEDSIAEKGSGSTFDAITGKQLKSFMIPLAPLAEQQRIVANLDRKAATVGEIEMLAHHQIGDLEVLRSILLRQAFSGDF